VTDSAWEISARRFDKVYNYAKLPVIHLLSTKFCEEPNESPVDSEPMLPLSLSNIDEAFLRQLCKDGCPESQTLDFKRELPEKNERDKIDPDKYKDELCKDVAAFANADGGHLVYGIQEKAGVANDIVPISTESADAAERRIRHVLEGRIEPQIHGLTFHKIDFAGAGYVLILRVPASYDGPHCIRTEKNHKQQRRFVMRNGTMISDMSYDQIRGAFDRTATLAEQARGVIATRRQNILDGETPVPLRSGPKLVVHLVPVAGLAGRMSVDLKQIKRNASLELKGNNWSGSSSTFNLDGLVIHPDGLEKDTYSGYNHIFRTGSLESACFASAGSGESGLVS
jgi:hypothetical protein